MQAERAHEHTNSPTAQPGVAWRSCDVRACDSGRLTHEIRPQTVPLISFRLDFHFFCPIYVFLKDSRYSDASVAYRRVPYFFSY